jgi:hypothetical protein
MANAVSQDAEVHATLGQDWITNWIIPWVYNKLILGLMARWKAIYLINGYDQIWSTLQNLCTLAKQPLSPLKITIPSSPIYGTNPGKPNIIPLSIAATGNWSARELINVLDTSGFGGAVNPEPIIGTSVWQLIQVLDNIAKGNWAAPPGYSENGQPVASRPLGLRERLAAAAV